MGFVTGLFPWPRTSSVAGTGYVSLGQLGQPHFLTGFHTIGSLQISPFSLALHFLEGISPKSLLGDTNLTEVEITT